MVSTRKNAGIQVLELQSGVRSFAARLDHAAHESAMSVTPGTRLELTGVYSAQGGNRASGQDIASFELMLDSPQCIRVLARPPWWTLQRLLGIVGALALVLAFSVLWITQLHRQVAERTAELTQEMQKREAAQGALAQAQRLEAVGRLAGGLVHDFNNALTAISTNRELAEARIADPEARDAVHKALEAVELSAGLNRRLLTFARRGTFTRQIVSVNDRVTGVLRLLERAVGPNLALKADLASDLWPTEIDPLEIDSAMRSGETGLTTKSKAPARIACTTVSIPPCPVCTITGI